MISVISPCKAEVSRLEEDVSIANNYTGVPAADEGSCLYFASWDERLRLEVKGGFGV